MIVKIYAYYKEGEKLERPEEYSGFLKMYGVESRDGFGRINYMLIRDLATQKSIIPPLYEFRQSFINGVENLVYYTGHTRENGGRNHQVWAINYCDAITINEHIETGKMASKDSFSYESRKDLEDDLKL